MKRRKTRERQSELSHLAINDFCPFFTSRTSSKARGRRRKEGDTRKSTLNLSFDRGCLPISPSIHLKVPSAAICWWKTKEKLCLQDLALLNQPLKVGGSCRPPKGRKEGREGCGKKAKGRQRRKRRRERERLEHHKVY